MGISQSVFAAHLKGGYVEYTYLGPTPGLPNSSRYKVVVYQYLDCGSSAGQIDLDVFLAVFFSGTNQLDQQKTVPLSKTTTIAATSFECINNPPPVCYRVDSYETEIDLVNNPQPYTLAVQRCCRIGNIANVMESGGTGVTYTVVINTNRPNGSSLVNSSPVFSQKDAVIVCADNPFTFPFEATDPDGDSLRFRFIGGLNTPSRLPKPNPPPPPPFFDVGYQFGFSAASPLGDGVVINPQNGIISGTAPSISGDYVVAVMVEEYRQGVKIGEARKEIHITVGNCDIPRADLPIRIINCDNFTVTFENGSNSSGILSYNWDFGVGNSSSDVSTEPRPSFTYPDTGVYMVKLLVNKDSKCPGADSTEVRVFPGFEPKFDVSGVCQQLPYQFTDRTTTRYGVVNSWKWDFGDPSFTNDTSRLRNAQFTYQQPGLYNITLMVATTKGCSDTITTPLEVLERPKIQLAFRDTLICSIDSLPLNAIGTGNFSWSPASRIVNANTPNPIVFPTDTTTYYVFLNDRGCTATDSVRVNVLKFITIDAGPDTTICRTDGIQLAPKSFALSYQWQPASLFNNATIKNPVVTPTDSLTTIYVNANLGKCQANDSMRIRTVPYPIVNAGNDTTICFGTEARLMGSGNGTMVNWTPASTLSNATNYSTIARPTQTSLYTLTVSATLGCPKPVQDQVLVTVRPRINLFAGNDTSVVYNQLLQLNAVSNGLLFRWTPATALSAANIPNPTAVFRSGILPAGTDTIRYTVTASTPEGCSATDNLLVKVFSTAPTVFVPSAFTPNADGRNDLMRPTLAGMRELSFFRIYNRYGQLVFETRTPGRGWDGKLNGVLQNSGVFVYQCQAIDFEGNTSVVKGSFVLVR